MSDISVQILDVNSVPLSECKVLGIPKVGRILSITNSATVLAVWSFVAKASKYLVAVSTKVTT